ncbi:protein kinase [Vibrio parahaemolyticus]|uniref:protein kinase domain-containing protein n=2 Tax=Vibrio TaxID=662 RepID=UPI00084AE35C|nr:protein kinase [Vibrio parahaemolyticus]EGQ7945979.1 protein kinase [Vibrio parahaemolyticus]EGQ8034919.1 protein kinase [Vibrio parahaemolyticus]EHE7894777.1 protein kinase [Vibrio parahaemolyticus]EHH2464432.1 protein kinase [Vibrio parahaemolyticus]EHH2496213.1 protein kinase [Vibrio parahaemolyticus]
MKYALNDVIDGRFQVKGLCSDEGGMGQILFVTDLHQQLSGDLVLKYCREEEEEYVKRFKREVRLLETFNGNSKVVNTLHSNTDNETPYFVMPFYRDGDLTKLMPRIMVDPTYQETIFNKMIDCIQELHSNSVFHRDIKPQNFLIEGENVLVSDFGLGMEPNSSSRFTSSSMFWGTQGYLPPEYQNGGFKHADERGDIFMLGKSFYVLLTGQNPTYLMDTGLHPALFHVIQRACELDHNRRYKSLSEMKQAMKSAYDVILSRGGSLGEVNQLISTIEDRLKNENKYTPAHVIEFIEKLQLVERSDQVRICMDLSRSFMSILPQQHILPHLEDFLKVYSVMVESNQYSWAFAESIALSMEKIFNNPLVEPKLKAKALELAIDAAVRMNRFAAMDTCTSMITSVTEQNLGNYVVSTMQKFTDSFVDDIEASQCKCNAITNYLTSLKSA